MRRRDFIRGGSAAAWPLAAGAQQSNQTHRIGVLMGPAESDPEAQSKIAAFRRGLQDLGWTGGRNVLGSPAARGWAMRRPNLPPDMTIAEAAHLPSDIIAELIGDGAFGMHALRGAPGSHFH